MPRAASLPSLPLLLAIACLHVLASPQLLLPVPARPC
jgi:hypothetical protein